MNEISFAKKFACIVIAIVTNFIMFSSGIVGDLSVVYTTMFLTVPTYAAMILIFPTYLYLLFPIVMVVSIYFVTDNIVVSLLSIMFLILAALCAEGVLHKRTKFNTVVRMSVVFFSAAIFLFVLTVYITQGYFSREAIIEFSNDIIEEFTASIEHLGGNVNDFVPLFQQMSMTIPACLLMLFVILSYVSCTFTRKIVCWFNCEYRLFNFDNYWEFEMPIETAYIFIFTYALLFFEPILDGFPPALDVVIYVVIYPLMCGMIISGIKQIRDWIKYKSTLKSGKGLIVALIIISLVVFPNLVLSATSFIGVYRCFNKNKSPKWKVEK